MAEEMLPRVEKNRLWDLCSAEGSCRVEAEILLPEYKEEAERIIRMIPKAVIRSKHCYFRDRQLICEVEGSVGFHLLYQTPTKENSCAVSSFMQGESFSYAFRVPYQGQELSEEALGIFVEAVPEAFSAKLQGPRRVGVKCDLALSLSVKSNRPLMLFSEELPEELVISRKELRATSLRAVHTEEISFSETICLPKAYLPIEELCEMNAVLSAQNVLCEDGGIRFTGLCDLHCSYTAKGEDLFVSFYQPVEFERRVGIAEVSAGSLCRVQLSPVHLKATPDINEEGENKNILFELSFSLEAQIFETEPLLLIEDAFSVKNDLNCEKSQERADEILGILDFSSTVKTSLAAKDPALVRCESVCGNTSFRNSYLEDGKLYLEGRLEVSYLGIAENGEIRQLSDRVDFKTEVSTGSLYVPEGEECRIEVCGAARSTELEIDGESLLLRFELCGNITVYLCHRPEMICCMKSGEELTDARDRIVFVYPREGESLWEIAKAYHISPERIRAQNHLTADRLPPYLKLIY